MHFVILIGNIRAFEYARIVIEVFISSRFEFQINSTIQSPLTFVCDTQVSFHHFARLIHKCTIQNQRTEQFLAHEVSDSDLYE